METLVFRDAMSKIQITLLVPTSLLETKVRKKYEKYFETNMLNKMFTDELL